MNDTTNDDKARQRRLPKYRPARERFGPMEVTARDLEILELVYHYRYLHARHVYALVPGNARHLARRLQALFHHGYLQRLVPPSRMRLSGSPKMAYGLDTAGAKLLAERVYEVPVGHLTWRKAQNRRTEWFVEHAIEVSNFHAGLELAVEAAAGLELLEWRQDQEARGVCRWKIPGRAGEEEFRVSPDAYCAVSEHGTRRNFFVEIDRSTEESRRIHEKFERYGWYLTHPQYRKDHPERPDDVRVLVVTTGGEERVQGMMEALRKLAKGLDHRGKAYRKVPGLQPGWFWFGRTTDYALEKPEGLLEPIWRTVKQGERPLALFG